MGRDRRHLALQIIQEVNQMTQEVNRAAQAFNERIIQLLVLENTETGHSDRTDTPRRFDTELDSGDLSFESEASDASTNSPPSIRNTEKATAHETPQHIETVELPADTDSDTDSFGTSLCMISEDEETQEFRDDDYRLCHHCLTKTWKEPVKRKERIPDCTFSGQRRSKNKCETCTEKRINCDLIPKHLAKRLLQHKGEMERMRALGGPAAKKQWRRFEITYYRVYGEINCVPPAREEERRRRRREKAQQRSQEKRKEQRPDRETIESSAQVPGPDHILGQRTPRQSQGDADTPQPNEGQQVTLGRISPTPHEQAELERSMRRQRIRVNIRDPEISLPRKWTTVRPSSQDTPSSQSRKRKHVE